MDSTRYSRMSWLHRELRKIQRLARSCAGDVKGDLVATVPAITMVITRH